VDECKPLHAGSTVDGALVLLHGRREAGGGGGRDAGVYTRPVFS